MSEYEEIKTQIAELQRKAATIRETERVAAIENIKSLMATFEISRSELSSNKRPLKRAKSANAERHSQKVPPKYQNSSGNQWSGRGLQPRWLKAAIAKGATVESFLI